MVSHFLFLIHFAWRAGITWEFFNRDHPQFGFLQASKPDGFPESFPCSFGTIERNGDFFGHTYSPSCCAGYLVLVTGAGVARGVCRVRIPSAAACVGKKNACAIRVGTTALKITTVTSTVYCV